MYKIEEVKYHKNMILIKFFGIDTVEQAQMLRTSILIKKREELKPLKQDQYYIVDLIGLDVYTDENELLRNIRRCI